MIDTRGNLSYSIVESLWNKNRIFCSSDYDTSLEHLKSIIPLTIHEYRAPHQGWEIPPKWDLVKATIAYDGNVIFEASHPLHVIGLSSPFSGRISLDELKQHLHSDSRDPTSTPYHFRQHYRPWQREWGFCVPKTFIDALNEGDYDVEIVTDESEGILKIASCDIQGSQPYSFAFVAHLDHPGMANDDLAGVAVGIEVFKELSKMNLKFSYKLVIVQEMIGSEYYLHQHANNRILNSCFLEMLGSETPLSLQKSYHANSRLEHLLERVMVDKGIPCKVGPFRSIVCNDEAIWESYGIPMCSLSRYPYPEYHSDKDNLSIISKKSLEQAVSIVLDCINSLEASTLIEKQFTGAPGVANPSYGLYVDPGQPAFNNVSAGPLRKVMDTIPLLPKVSFAEELAIECGCPLAETLDYLTKWEGKGLLKLI